MRGPDRNISVEDTLGVDVHGTETWDRRRGTWVVCFIRVAEDTDEISKICRDRRIKVNGKYGISYE